MLIREKVAQAQRILRELGVDCWLTFARESGINGDPSLAFLLAGEVTWHSAILVTPDGARAIVGQYDRLAVEELGVYDEVVGYVQGVRTPLQDALRAIEPARIAINYSRSSEVCDGLTHGMYLELCEHLEGIGMASRLESAEPVISALRARKTPAELERLRAAIRAAEEILELTAGFMKAGRSEVEIASYMQAQVREAGLGLAWDPATCPTVFTGPAHAGAHYHPTERRLEPGHVVNIDFGVRVDGYVSDLQRTYYVSRPGESRAPEAVEAGFATIVGAIERARAAMRPGVLGEAVDRAAREHVTAAGYEEFPHGLGHQVGRFAHDGTALLGPPWEKYRGKVDKPLEEGMVFTLEPRLEIPGHGIATVENMVVVTADGAEYLSTPQEELITIR